MIKLNLAWQGLKEKAFIVWQSPAGPVLNYAMLVSRLKPEMLRLVGSARSAALRSYEAYDCYQHLYSF